MITNERKRVIEGSLEGATPEERRYVSDYVRRCLPGFYRDVARRVQDDNDYEGAILARQERSGMYD